ncbi:MAG: inorganic phosphate transporter [Rikenellaceae bacterium]|nr:inorganic phosphate transporter [Rikenellaceae bacterium]
MEIFYVGIIGFLFILAIFDLMVGVSNDAVNFLGSAVGAKVASFRTIITVAAIGVLCGALFSNGMMEIARHGIYRPEHFGFVEILTICLAVMVTDVVLLDIFNSLGLPTSTTVSMVFELLGGAFALALVKIAADDTLTFAQLLNTEKALSVIMGIFVSVAIAFFFGALVQWLARLLFTFNYKRRLKWFAGLFGGVAVTSIIYFILIKGLKDSSFMTPEYKQWVSDNTLAIVLYCFVGSTIIMQILHALRVNIFKVVVLLGTFALAMAFAGNDLVNFVGVPLAGYAAYNDYATAGGFDPNYLMTALNEPAKTPFIFLAISGVIMIIALVTSKKAHNVIKTSVDLSRQDEGDEMFGSSAAARSLVRAAMNISKVVVKYTHARVRTWVDSRFNSNEIVLENGAAFDQLRAAINLLLASLLIALGTSLKLPLSTTYVTFMVAMGTSLADRAWSRESAVFRITGVMSVVGGWFITAGAAFTLCFLVTLLMHFTGAFGMIAMIVVAIVLLVRSNIRYNRKARAEHEDNIFQQILASHDKNQTWDLLRRHCREALCSSLDYASETYMKLTNGFINDDRRTVRKAHSLTNGQKEILKRRRRKEMVALRRIDLSLAMEKNTWFHVQSNCCEQFYYILKRACEPCVEHVENNFNQLPKEYADEFIPVRNLLDHLITRVRRAIDTGDYSKSDELNETGAMLRAQIQTLRTTQIYRIHDEQSDLKVSLVYLSLLSESQELLASVMKLLRASNRFQN